MKKKTKMILAALFCLLLILATACGTKAPVADTAAAADEEIKLLDENTTYEAVIEVENYGNIVFTLRQDAAPVSAANFVSLAKEGFYDGLTFHRIINGFMIQGGDPNGNGTGGSGKNIKGEFKANGVENGISHTKGVISMARSSAPDSASSQFFIMVADYPSLDGQYAAFGHVTEGQEVADQIAKDARPVDNNGTIPAAEQPVIESIVVID